MSGLLTKDWLLMRSQRVILLMFCLCGVIMSVSFDQFAGISYLVILGTMISVSTISYDEMNHGIGYLLTLPISRRTYVREKYLFSCIGSLCCLVIGMVISSVITLRPGSNATFDMTDFAMTAIMSIAIACVYMSVILPIRIRFDVEKSRFVQMIVFGVFLGLTLGITKLGSFIGEDKASAVRETVSRIGDLKLGLLCLAVGIVLLLISEKISEKIIAKKEY
jgi:hypothetical protein